jgi:DNA repair photolyase
MQLSRFNSSVKGFCTCQPKYNLNTYLGRCGHECIYCYATKFPTFNGPPMPRTGLAEQIEVTAKNTKVKLPVMISDCTDPYQPLEREHQLTRKCIQALVVYGFPLLIVTKSDMVTRDIDLFKKTPTVVSVTVTTIREDIAKRIEPNAPAPEKRIKAIEKIVEASIPAVARIDPIIPHVNDDLAEFETLVAQLADVGVRQVTISTVKPVRGFFTKIKQTFPEKYEELVNAYKDAEWLMSYKYLAARRRKAMVNKLKPIVLKYSMEFAACREGFPELNTTTCDGTAYCQTTTTLTKYIK